MTINTVGQLRQLIKDLPDHTEILISIGDDHAVKALKTEEALFNARAFTGEQDGGIFETLLIVPNHLIK